MTQPKRSPSGFIRCNYNGLIHIGTAEDAVLTETSILTIKNFRGETQQVLAGEVTFFNN